MIQELLYTSAPKGLKPGSRGFCTVLSTSGMPAPVATALEALSGYRPVFPPGDPRSARNPVVFSHMKMSLSGRRSDVFSRIADYGLDYSQRTNKLAHHLVIDATDRPQAGPGWLLAHSGMMRDEWNGELKVVSGERSVPQANADLKICSAWANLTGDAGWAGVLAEAFLKHPEQPAYMIFAPGMDLLPLMEEAIALLPVNRRWDVTFSTYFTKIPNGVACNWRCLLADSPEAKESRRYVQSLRIDLTTDLPHAPNGPLVEAARTGVMPEGSFLEAGPSVHRPAPPVTRPIDGHDAPIRIAQEPKTPPIVRAKLPSQPKRPTTRNIKATMAWFLAVVVIGSVGTAAIYLQRQKAAAATTAKEPLANKNEPSTEPPPQIEIKLVPTTFNIKENEEYNATVGTINVAVDDAVKVVPSFTIKEEGDGKHFEIDGNNIKAKNPFDYEKKQQYSFQIEVSGNGIKTATSQIVVTVEDVQELPEKITISKDSVDDRTPEKNEVGTFKTLYADNKDSLFEYEVAGDNRFFEVSGDKLLTKSEINKNESNHGKFTIKIRSVDQRDRQLHREQDIDIQVKDNPKPWPLLTYFTDPRGNLSHSGADEKFYVSDGLDLDGRPSLKIEIGNIESPKKELIIKDSKIVVYREEDKDTLLLEISKKLDTKLKRHFPFAALHKAVPWSDVIPFFCFITAPDASSTESATILFTTAPRIQKRPDKLLVSGFHSSLFKEKPSSQLRVDSVVIEFSDPASKDSFVVVETSNDWNHLNRSEKGSTIEKLESSRQIDVSSVLKCFHDKLPILLNGQIQCNPFSKYEASLLLNDFSQSAVDFSVRLSVKPPLVDEYVSGIASQSVEILNGKFPVKSEPSTGGDKQSPAKWSSNYSSLVGMEQLKSMVDGLKTLNESKLQFITAPDSEQERQIREFKESLERLRDALLHPTVSSVVIEKKGTLNGKDVWVPVLVFPADMEARSVPNK